MTTEVQESVEHVMWRNRRAITIAEARRQLDADDLQVEADATVESVDGGYWVPARIYVDADDVGDPGPLDIAQMHIEDDFAALSDVRPSDMTVEQRALRVLILTRETRLHLEQHDPMALEQARATLGLTQGSRKS